MAEAWWSDELGSRLEALADRIEAEYADVCTVERLTHVDAPIRSVWISPSDSAASPTGWLDMAGGELQVYAGRGEDEGRWELGRTEADVEFIEQVLTSVLEGRVTQVSRSSRSRVAVTLADGTVEESRVSHGFLGLIPAPGWVSRGRTVRYAPYRA